MSSADYVAGSNNLPLKQPSVSRDVELVKYGSHGPCPSDTIVCSLLARSGLAQTLKNKRWRLEMIISAHFSLGLNP